MSEIHKTSIIDQNFESAYVTALLRSLKFGGVQFLRYMTVDCNNTIRCKAIPIAHLSRTKQSSLDCQTSIAAICLAGLPTYADMMLANETDMDARNVLIVKPDLSTLRVLPYAPKTAALIGTVHDQYTGELSPVCTRGKLLHFLEKAAKEQNIGFSVGAELEFCLYDAKTSQPVDSTTFASTATLNQQENFISELYSQLEAQDIPVELVHSESGPGQMEVVLQYQNNPVTLVDNVVMAKDTITMVAHKMSLKAIFLPKYNPMAAGNGLHLHMSIHDATTGEPLMCLGEPKLTPKGSSFVEGILQHLPSLLSFSLPTVNSFRRVGVGCWTGSAVTWAVEDKECGIRVCSHLRTKSWDHVEYKLCDSTANLYLALLGILSCGYNGIVNNLSLRPQGQQPTDGTVLPSCLEESLDLMEKDDIVSSIMDKSFIKSYLAIKRHEAARSNDMSIEQQLQEALQYA